MEPLRDRRGRPSYKVSKENQRFVMLRAGAGWTQAAIAADMGCDEKTLRKHFSRELEWGATMVEGELLDVLGAKARGGNVSAAREVRSMMEKGQQRRAHRMFASEDDKPEAEVAQGKKEAAAAAAREAMQPDDDDWGDDLNPMKGVH